MGMDMIKTLIIFNIFWADLEGVSGNGRRVSRVTFHTPGRPFLF